VNLIPSDGVVGESRHDTWAVAVGNYAGPTSFLPTLSLTTRLIGGIKVHMKKKTALAKKMPKCHYNHLSKSLRRSRTRRKVPGS